MDVKTATKATVIYPKGSFGSEITQCFTFEIPEETIEVKSPLDTLDYIFRRMNTVDGSDIELPQKFGCRSMCMGDIVKINKLTFRCEPFGWSYLSVTGNWIQI